MWSDLIRRSWAENRLFSVLVELTYRCNWDCVFCYNDLGLHGTALRKEQYFELFDELKDLGVLNLVLSGGEPLAHPDFLEIGEHARRGGFVVRLKSNAYALRGRLAQEVKDRVDPFIVEVSLHGSTAEIHDRQTRVDGSFVRLLENLGELKRLGYRIKINSVLTRWNEHQADGMFAIADGLELPIHIEPEVTPRDNGDRSPLDLSPSRAGIENLFSLLASRAREAAAQTQLEAELKAGSATDAPTQRQPPTELPSTPQEPSDAQESDAQASGGAQKQGPQKHCGAGSSALAIDPFGNVYPCVQWRRAAGNLHNRSIRDIWQGSPVLTEVRGLTEQVHEKMSTLGVGVAQRMAFCPGSAELHTGDPLAVYDPAAERLAASEAAEGPVRPGPVRPVRSLPIVEARSGR